MPLRRLLCLTLLACAACLPESSSTNGPTATTGGDTASTGTDGDPTSGAGDGTATAGSDGSVGGTSDGSGSTTGDSGGTSSSSGDGSTAAASSGGAGTTGAPPDAGELRVAEWNMEFFGRADAGPTNDALQTTNATTVIGQLAPDLLGVEEVCDDADFASVVSGLSAQYGETYGYVLANDPSIGNAYANYGGWWGQKTGLLYRTSVFTRFGTQLVYRSDIDPNWGSTFSSRTPLEVQLRINATGTYLYVLVVHLKADADSASYQQRVQASQDLKTYLDGAHPHDRVMVVGDWNDDLVGSITHNQASPFSNFLGDANYLFATQPLADAHQSTTDDHSGHPIDHHLINQPLFDALISGSVTLIQPNITGYSTNTSDHYPTLVRYRTP